MKPKFVVSYDGTNNFFAVFYWKDKKAEIPHEAFPVTLFNSVYQGWLFSDDEIAVAFAETLNVKIRNTIKKFQKLNKQKMKKEDED